MGGSKKISRVGRIRKNLLSLSQEIAALSPSEHAELFGEPHEKGSSVGFSPDSGGKSAFVDNLSAIQGKECLARNPQQSEHEPPNRMQLENFLGESEAQGKILSEASPALVWSAYPDGRAEFVNQRFIDYTGLTAEQVNQAGWQSVIHPGDVNKLVEVWTSAAAKGKNYQAEFRHRRYDGEYRWFLVNAVPLKKSNGMITKWLGVSIDIHDRKLAETELRLTAERLQAIIASPLIGIVIGDAQGTLYQVNDYYLNLLGYTREEFEQGKVRWDAITPNEYLPRDEQAIRELKERGVCTPYEKEYCRKDGSRVWVLINDALLPEENSLIVGFILDITGRKLAEKQALDRDVEIELQHRLLEQRERERLKIAQDLHDGPMQGILGAVYSLKEIVLDYGEAEISDRLQPVINLLQDQLAEMRWYASELRPPILIQFGLTKAIRGHIHSLQEKYPDIHISFRCDQAEQMLPEPLLVPLFRIYQEVINNIGKHADASEVKIHLEKNIDGLTRLTIQDNGCGFKLPRNWLSLARKGHLGMVGMRERAEAIGGTLEVTSTPGSGTTIQVSVPRNYRLTEE